MGWSIGYDNTWERDIGYGVPAHCDHPGCRHVIDRGLSYVCGGEPYGGEHGCGLYFCYRHLYYVDKHEHQVCERCRDGKKAFNAKPDHKKWIRWKLKHESWAKWRKENPDEVRNYKAILGMTPDVIEAK